MFHKVHNVFKKYKNEDSNCFITLTFCTMKFQTFSLQFQNAIYSMKFTYSIILSYRWNFFTCLFWFVYVDFYYCTEEQSCHHIKCPLHYIKLFIKLFHFRHLFWGSFYNTKLVSAMCPFQWLFITEKAYFTSIWCYLSTGPKYLALLIKYNYSWNNVGEPFKCVCWVNSCCWPHIHIGHIYFDLS